MSFYIPSNSSSGVQRIDIAPTGGPAPDRPGPLPGSPIFTPTRFEDHPFGVNDHVVDEPRDVQMHLADEAHGLAQTPPVPKVKSERDKAIDKLNAASTKFKQARDEGVNIAEASFYRKLIKVATSALTVGIAAALTALSFGGAAPLLAVASINLAVSVGDAVCAYRAAKNAMARAAGLDPPHHLPEGTSCVKNLLHVATKALGGSDERAAQVAKYGGAFVSLGLAAASMACGHGVGALPIVPKVLSMCGSLINACATGGIAIIGAFESGKDGDASTLQLEALHEANEALNKLAQLDQRAYQPDNPDRDMRLLLEYVRKPDAHARGNELLKDAVKNLGNAKLNGVLALGGLAGVGIALAGA